MNNNALVKNKNTNQRDVQNVISDDVNDLIRITESVLLDFKNDITQKEKLSMPIAQLATLGGGVASMLPAFRTVTTTSTAAVDGLYRLSNAALADILKASKDGDFWGALKTVAGKSKMAKFKKVEEVITTNQTIVPIDPATTMMAVALYSIEQQLGRIEEMQKSILSFLEIEKESEIEADIATVFGIIEKYKHNWDNDHFISSNHKMVIDIQRAARKNMVFYQKKVKDTIKNKKLIVLQSKIKTTLDGLMKDFKYYRLSLFAFSMASLLEIMLSGNFKEDNILAVKEDIQKLAFEYREIYADCSLYLESMEKSSVESNLLRGVGFTGKAVGKFIGSIPKIRDGQLDERLQESSEQVKERVRAIESDSIVMFAELSNPGTSLFTERMDELIIIYNRTAEICFDANNIYLITD